MNCAKATFRQGLLIAGFALAVAPATLNAEDIDIFVSGVGSGAVGSANVLVVIDNTSNWADNAQHWPSDTDPDCGTSQYQGQAELCALIKVIPTLPDNINVGFMLFNQNGSGNCCSGGYIRFAVKGLGAINPATGNTNRTDLVNELTNVLQNFLDPSNKAASNASYSMALFDVFKYFGGYTSPAHANDGIAGAPVDATHFGTPVFSTPSITYNRPDQDGYTSSTFRTYFPPPDPEPGACGGKDYIIFIGNGFPNTDTPPTENMKTFLEGIGGDSTQVAMPVLTTTSTTTNTNLGFSALCYNNNGGGVNKCSGDNASTCGVSYDTCACVNNPPAFPTTTTGCSAGKVKYSIAGGITTTTITPTNTSCAPGTPGCPYPANSIRYADEWTKYLYQADVSAAAGQQNVTTFTIDVFNAKQNADQTALLYSMANQGGGQYYAARNKNQLIVDLGDIFSKILGRNSVFASASLPVSATNRAVNANEVYLGMFRPDPGANALWWGNMKRYKIGNFGGSFDLADVAGKRALNPLTGFLDACATSYWTTDSGQFWQNSSTQLTDDPPPCGTSATNPFSVKSDSPDGPHVEKGAVAEAIRKGNNPAATATWTLNRTLYTNNFATYDTTSSGMTSTDVDFVKGLNIDAAGNQVPYNYDPTDPTKTTNIRPAVHGDVIHSRPIAINYPSGQTAIFYGANDGWFRAADSATGKELWAYVAPEFYSRLSSLRQDSVPLPHNYFFDGSIGAYQNANSSSVWIFPSMRRGGRMIYGFNVTSPNSPSLLWKKGCPNLSDDTGCDSGFSGIGQTWSTPNVALLKIGGTVGETPTPVVAVGGGYDGCEDGSGNDPCTSAKGSIAYILNASTGAMLNSFATTGASTGSGTTPAGRVVADMVWVDLDADGIPDFGYVVDTRGTIYRLTFGMSRTAPLDAASWTMTPIAYTTGADRKFLNAPALAPARDSATGKNYVYLALGSGDREQPLSTQYPFPAAPNPGVLNRFYVFLDDLSVTPNTPVNLDDDTANGMMTNFNNSNYIASTSCTSDFQNQIIPGSGKSGWFMNLNAACPSNDTTGCGEQAVTTAAIAGGFVSFSTYRAIPPAPNTCAPKGQGRGYAVNLFDASGVIGAQPNICGGDRSEAFPPDTGIPPSPVIADVNIDGTVVNICIGCPNFGGGASSNIGPQKVPPLPKQARKRTYWRQEGGN